MLLIYFQQNGQRTLAKFNAVAFPLFSFFFLVACNEKDSENDIRKDLFPNLIQA